MKPLAALAVLLCLSPRPVAMEEEQPRQTFRASVALVPITAVVRDSRNRLVRDLTRDDFQVLENGRPKPIVDFKATDRAPVSLALLLDTSGSMRGSSLDRARHAADYLLNLIDRTSDEVALFTFDKAVREEAGFTNEPDTIRRALGNTDAWGLTSLYDAIADTAKRLEDRHTQRRAVVVITDGIDTSSTRTAAQVSGLASAIDVPVYVITVAEPPPPGARPVDDASLVELAFWTGGDVKRVIIPDLVGTTIAELMDELRQQYFLAIESAASDAWHRLEIKARPENLQVRARSGYFGMRSARSRPKSDCARTTARRPRPRGMGGDQPCLRRGAPVARSDQTNREPRKGTRDNYLEVQVTRPLYAVRRTTTPNMIRYQANTTKSCVLM